MSTPLTEQEREALRAARPNMHWTEQAVEVIVAARVAAERDRLLGKVEALADEWATTPGAFVQHGSVLANAWVAATEQVRALVAEERAT